MSEVFEIDRDSNVPLRFTGEIIAEADSDDGFKEYWQQIRIYRVSDGRYVVEAKGCNRVGRDARLSTVTIADDPLGVRAALTRHKEGRSFLTNVALDALDEAAENDPAFVDATVEVL